MCGIAGTTEPNETTLQDFLRRLGHRGPDDRGVWSEPGIGLAHTRLAVIDLSPSGHQPMMSACGRWVICYNGEIYNYRELRQRLEREGVQFRSASDTEVLMMLVARHGVSALNEVAGMFAFALWDRVQHELLLVRDRLGIKPLVYAPLANGGLAFASEIEALRFHAGVNLDLDREALSAYLACLYVPAPRSIHAGIRKLPPGHVLKWRAGNWSTESYWTPRASGGRSIGVDAAVEEILPVLRRAVQRHLVADVPVGCFLSGGIDSSVIAALMSEVGRGTGQRPRSFTMTFAEPAYDERREARAVAEHVGAIHMELPASPSVTGESLDELVRAFGEPFGNPTAFLVQELSRLARRHVTVALVGDGGDEVFAGYPRYQGGLLASTYRRLPCWLRHGAIEPAAALVPESSRGWHFPRRLREFVSGASLDDRTMYASWVEYFSPDERAALLGGAAPPRPIAEVYSAASSSNPLDAMQETDLLTFLPGNILAYGDAMSMSCALELRPPFLDHEVVEATMRVAASTRVADGLKTLLKAVAARLLPPDIVRRPKRGFNPPMGIWLRGELNTLVRERLTRNRLSRLGIDWAPVERLLNEQRSGRRDHALKIWALLVADAWHSHVRNPAAAS